MHRLKFFVERIVICILLFAWFEDRLLCSRIYVSCMKIIVGNKHFKLGNYLLKKDSRDFSKIAIEAGRRGLCGHRLFFWRGKRGRLDKTI